jgi:hypothetical protein
MAGPREIHGLHFVLPQMAARRPGLSGSPTDLLDPNIY